jgi:hypothetical protein
MNLCEEEKNELPFKFALLHALPPVFFSGFHSEKR